MNLNNEDVLEFDLNKTSLVDDYILNKLNETVLTVKNQLDKYEISLAGNALYHFVWDDFCDWYIELSKANLNGSDQLLKKGTLMTLRKVLSDILILLHPFIPFVTDEIYTVLTNQSIYDASYPEVIKKDFETDEINLLIKIISSLRELKVSYNLKPKTNLQIQIFDSNEKKLELSLASKEMLNLLVQSEIVDSLNEVIVVPLEGAIIKLEKGDLVDLKAELARLEKEALNLKSEIKRSENILSNQKFLDKAPLEKVTLEKEKLEDYRLQYEIVLTELSNIKKELN